MAVEGLRITHHESGDRGEYRAIVPGSDAVGRLTWKARGIAAALVEKLVADAREHGFKIAPQCSYVEAKFRRNPDWADLRA
jgi:uncharacterized protein